MRTLKDFNFSSKKVLLRCGFDVPFDEQGRILDDKRIVESLPTIKYLLEHGAAVIIIAHNGRPDGQIVPRLSMEAVGRRLSALLQRPVLKLNDCTGATVDAKIQQMRAGDIILLENLRFHKEEKAKDERFAKQLATLADLFVQDAYNNAHHADASMTLIPKYLPSCAGFCLEKELSYVKQLTQNPKRPYVAIIGGAKAEKLLVIQKLLDKTDHLIIGGVLANTFLKAKGIDIKTSKYDAESLKMAKKLAENPKIVLPEDAVGGSSRDAKAEAAVVDFETLPQGWMILDIGPKTIEQYKQILGTAKTIIWCGPVGAFEIPQFSTGTKAIAEYLAELKATTIIGGGDSADAVDQLGLSEKMTHVSVGGGATLTVLAGKELPAVKALEENEKMFQKQP